MEFVVLAIAAVLIFVVVWLKEQALADPSNRQVIYVDQMVQELRISDGTVHAVLMRQSGNVYNDLGLFDAASSALHEVSKSFKRAKIDSVYVQTSNEKRFSVIRLHHSHRGKAEGKKLGGAVIEKV